MTLAMPDSIRVSDLPDGYPAYLGYEDGRWPTADALKTRFPAAHRVILTVTGTTLIADGCDIETGDLTPADAADWAAGKIANGYPDRPVMYASVSIMPLVVRELAAVGVPRAAVRLLSAHWGHGQHICGPNSCAAVSFPVDGTQWTNDWFVGVPGGAYIDMSMLANGFFDRPETGTEKIVRELGIVRQGDSGEAVRTVQGLLVARWFSALQVDGVFGSLTESAVRQKQNAAGITQDGVVGPQTWPVLLGIAP